jgi:hypothetical protein
VAAETATVAVTAMVAAMVAAETADRPDRLASR